MAGIAVGAIVHLFLAAFGVAAVAAAWPLSLLLLQFGGALYLIWLGIQRTRANRAAAMHLDPAAQHLATIFRQGVVVNLTNPKTVLFLLAFLPQFMRDDGGPVWQQMLALGFTFILIAGATDAGYALAAGHLRGRLRQGTAPSWGGYLAASVYVALGGIGIWDAARQLG